MTVIRRPQQQVCNYTSCNNSDTESLHLGSVQSSDAESVASETVTLQRRPRTKPCRNLNDAEVNSRQCIGKKKLRRYQNVYILKTLYEEDEEASPTLMESYEGPFTRLLENNNALEFWNTFIEKSEEEQSEILEILSKGSKQDTTECTKQERPFARISAKIKRTLKVRRELAKTLLTKHEFEVVEFFVMQPESIFVQEPSTSFERLLLHALAQYHALKSDNITVGEKKRVQMRNVSEDWAPVTPNLCELIRCK